MNEQKTGQKPHEHERLPELAAAPRRPESDAELDPEADPEALPDFAAEHDTTAVSEDITTGRDKEREEESPHGWSGLQP